MASEFLSGFQVGANVASDAMNRNLRLQELRSQEALRRVQERNSVMAMEEIMRKRTHEIDYSAAMVKGETAASLASAETIFVPGPDGSGTYEIPNPNRMAPEEARLKFVGPVVAEFEPEKTFQFARDMMAVSINREQEKRLGGPLQARPLTPEAKAAMNALEKQRLASAKASDATAELRTAQKGEVGKDGVFAPTGGEVTMPDGSKIPFVKTSKGAAQLVIEPKIETLIDPKTGKEISVLRTGTSGARAIPENIGERQQRTMLTKWALENAPELMVTDEETGFVSLPTANFNEAARRAGIPNASRTLLNEQMIAASASFEVGRKLLPLITPENTGVQGKLRSVIVEKGLTQFFPNMKTGTRGEMVATVSNFRASLIRTLRSDGNIGVKELDAIIDGLPTPDEFWSSPQDAKAVMATQIELAAIKGRAAANILGKPIPPFYFKKEEIEELVTSKSISGDDAAKLWNGGAWKFIADIRAEVQR